MEPNENKVVHVHEHKPEHNHQHAKESKNIEISKSNIITGLAIGLVVALIAIIALAWDGDHRGRGGRMNMEQRSMFDDNGGMNRGSDDRGFDDKGGLR